jgi:aminoglycoside/choline kinase family phosphotransferase
VPVPADPDRFLRDADLVGAQRHIKIAGIFCRLFHRDGKPDYLRDIPLTLRYLGDECARLPELGDLASLLAELDIARRLQESLARTAVEGPGR